jgi:hypothetical protein
MRHRRDVLDVLSLIDQSTLNWSVLDTSASAPADSKMEPPGERYIPPRRPGHKVDPHSELALDFSIGADEKTSA